MVLRQFYPDFDLTASAQLSVDGKWPVAFDAYSDVYIGDLRLMGASTFLSKDSALPRKAQNNISRVVAVKRFRFHLHGKSLGDLVAVGSSVASSSICAPDAIYSSSFDVLSRFLIQVITK